MADRKTISVYDAKAADYARVLTSDHPYPILEAFIDALPPGGHVLDLGCGPGNASARMVERGLRVDPLDASVAMAKLAKERYGLEVRVATFDDLQAEAIYDGVWAHFSLLHAPRDALPGHLSAILRSLKSGGRFLIAVKLGASEARDRLERFYTYYTEAELEGLLAAAGFGIEGKDFGRDRGLDGSESDWIALHAVAQ